MADFDPPFDNAGERRVPSPDEQSNGFPCGPADRALFGGLFHRIESELGAVIAAAGISQSNSDYTQVLQAINALIAAATGGGEETDYVLMAQARVRLPIFPEIISSDGKIIISSPAGGTVRVPSGVTIRHRGIYEFTTTQTDFSTTASKTYHLRWNPTDGFTLEDLADGDYNPTTAAESDSKFDTKYDDMLIARVVTNGSNVATITNLVNLPFLRAEGNAIYSGSPLSRATDGSVTAVIPTAVLDWSRRPDIQSFNPVVGATATNTSYGVDGVANLIQAVNINRYQPTVTVMTDFQSPGTAISGFYARMRWCVGA